MAFRFRREGNYVKHRIHMDRMGMQPWLEDFKWRVTDFQYHWYMGPKATAAIRQNTKLSIFGASGEIGPSSSSRSFEEKDCEEDRTSSVISTRRPEANTPRHGPRREWLGRNIALRAFIPNIVPQRRQTNPFCLSSSNTTGWVEARSKISLLNETKPRTKHEISGTDDKIPEMPKYR
ncbi:unnamed protein product [Amoebophrya sp. A25]|nr:unnamed protein product [Amoebophrya sp. A25]|eukprot:GSA25T00025524001.1